MFKKDILFVSTEFSKSDLTKPHGTALSRFANMNSQYEIPNCLTLNIYAMIFTYYL